MADGRPGAARARGVRARLPGQRPRARPRDGAARRRARRSSRRSPWRRPTCVAHIAGNEIVQGRRRGRKAGQRRRKVALRSGSPSHCQRPGAPYAQPTSASNKEGTRGSLEAQSRGPDGRRRRSPADHRPPVPAMASVSARGQLRLQRHRRRRSIWGILALIVTIVVVVDLALARFSPATQIPTTQLGRDMTRAAAARPRCCCCCSSSSSTTRRSSAGASSSA